MWRWLLLLLPACSPAIPIGNELAATADSDPSPAVAPPPGAPPAAAPTTLPTTALATTASTSSLVATTTPSSVASSGPPAVEGPCPDDMVDVGVACIDRYEAPNVPGEKPLLMQSALDGDAWCRARGKRLCREVEWVRACMGKRGYNFPYGAKWKKGVCNDDKTWRPPRWAALRSHPSDAARRETERLDQSEPSGARTGCVSPDGVFDLTGNVAEWVVRTEDNETNYDHVVKGCYWARCFRPPHTPSCDYVNFAHQGVEASYEMGFRCCRDLEREGQQGGE